MVTRGFSRLSTAKLLTALALTAAACAPSAPALGASGMTRPVHGSETGSPDAFAPGTITTIGGGVGGPGPATTVAVGDPCALTYSGGTLYAGDIGGPFQSGGVRAISLRTGVLSTPVGSSGQQGFTRNGGLATGRVGWPCGLAVDKWHNLVFSDGDEHEARLSTGNDRVRVLAARRGTFYGQRMRAGRLYTIAGNGSFGHSGDGGPATKARLKDPGGLAIDRAGNVIIADVGNNRIRVAAAADGTFYGVRMHRGDIYTVAGNGKPGTAGLGGPATQAELWLRFGEPHGGVNYPSSAVRVDHQGNLVIADTNAALVLVLAAHTGTFYGQQMTAGHLYSIAGGGTNQGNGGLATSALIDANALAIDHAGNVLTASNTRTRVVAVRTGRFYGQQMTAGHIYSLHLRSQAVSVDGAGNVVAAGYGAISALAARSGRYYGKQMKAGQIYRIAGVSAVQSQNPVGPGKRIEIGSVDDINVDHQGNLVVSTLDNVFILAARTGQGYGRHLVRGHFYPIVSCKLDPSTSPYLCQGRAAGALDIVGFAVDAHGNLVLGGGGQGGLLVVAFHSGRFYGRAMTAGKFYLVAGGGRSSRSGIPSRLASIGALTVGVDPSGNLIEADGFLVRLIAMHSGTYFGHPRKAGYIYTIGGGGKGFGSAVPGRSVYMFPRVIRVDRSGNVVLADTKKNVVRVIAARTGTFYHLHMLAGDIYTIAGGGTSAADGVPARTAALHPAGIAIDPSGNVVVTDWCNLYSGCARHPTSNVRVLAEHTGVFYGRHMIAGRIYTIAGKGPVGFSGDGGPGTRALLEGASKVTFWPGRGAVIVDGIRLRLVTG